jgi:hypothetical protein
MACDLRCPECQDNLGKDTENHVIAYCGTCGHTFYNERGYREDLTEEDKEFIRIAEAKEKKRIRGFERRIGWRR